MTLLTKEQADQVSEAISNAEQGTDAELVTVLAKQADDYHYIPTLWAALMALVSPGFMIFTPFWLDLVDIVLVQLAVFLIMALTLRIPAVMRLIIPTSVKRWRASNLARRQFLENNLHHTAGDTGLLIFVAETERYVEIIADRGISKYVDDSEWEQIVAEFTQSVKQGKTLDGFLTTIAKCGEILKLHVPATGDRNELPNHLIIL